MAPQQTHSIWIVRKVQIKFDASVQTMMDWMMARLAKEGKGQFEIDWRQDETKDLGPSEDRGFRYVYAIEFTIVPKRFDQVRYDRLKNELAEACVAKRWGQYPWTMHDTLEGDPLDLASMVNLGDDDDEKDEKEITHFKNIRVEKGKFFKHLYGLGPQIDMILSALHAAVASDFTDRFHCVLHGPPGCGKTQTLEAVTRMVSLDGHGEGDAYIKLDAPSTTEAGAKELFLKALTVPAVCVIEEVEKIPEQALKWLLAVLDRRGEVRKTNYRVGQQVRKVHTVVLATVNNKDLFDRALSGALSSRFPMAIHYPRPTEDILRHILQREVERVKGDQRWVKKTIEFCRDELMIDEDQGIDPRKAIMICLCGRERLLTGEYQASLVKTLSREERRRHEIARTSRDGVDEFEREFGVKLD